MLPAGRYTYISLAAVFFHRCKSVLKSFFFFTRNIIEFHALKIDFRSKNKKNLNKHKSSSTLDAWRSSLTNQKQTKNKYDFSRKYFIDISVCFQNMSNYYRINFIIMSVYRKHQNVPKFRVEHIYILHAKKYYQQFCFEDIHTEYDDSIQ